MDAKTKALIETAREALDALRALNDDQGYPKRWPIPGAHLLARVS